MSSKRTRDKQPHRTNDFATVMDFEHAMWLLFGKEAYGIASLEEDPSSRREWLLKAIKRLIKEATHIDSTVRHREVLVVELQQLRENVRASTDPDWHSFYVLLSIVIRLFGYDYGNGERLHTPIYVQDASQHYDSAIAQGKKYDEYRKHQENVISIRRQLVKGLFEKGYDTFTISLIMNCSEYEVKKLRSTRDLSKAIG
jgi:hypothetical protein